MSEVKITGEEAAAMWERFSADTLEYLDSRLRPARLGGQITLQVEAHKHALALAIARERERWEVKLQERDADRTAHVIGLAVEAAVKEERERMLAYVEAHRPLQGYWNQNRVHNLLSEIQEKIRGEQ